jgi:hypothetical protein
MLWLVLKTSSARYTVGPADAIEFRGTKIFLPQRAEPVARYHSGSWIYSGHRCVLVECRAVLSIEFEDAAGNAGPRVGPRSVFHVRDRFAFAGRERIASLSVQADEWTLPGSNGSWSLIRLSENRRR